MANPDHAPYGKAAREALTKLGIWEQLQRENRLVFAENVLQTLQWAQQGSADAAIVARSLAAVTDGGKTLLIDDTLHAPLIQALAFASVLFTTAYAPKVLLAPWLKVIATANPTTLVLQGIREGFVFDHLAWATTWPALLADLGMLLAFGALAVRGMARQGI